MDPCRVSHLVGYPCNDEEGNRFPKPLNVDFLIRNTDTGGEILSLDPEVAELYWETVPNSVDQGGGAWYYPCNQSLPSVMFHFNDTDSTIEIRGEVLDSLSFDVGEECE